MHPTDGRIAFYHYGDDGYEIRVIDGRGLWQPVPHGTFEIDAPVDPVFAEKVTGVPASKPYKTGFMGVLLAPRVVLDVGKLKLGFYAFSNEALGKQSLSLSGLISHDRDLELDILYEFKTRTPTYYFRALRMTHHVEEDIVDRDRDGRVYNRIFALNALILGSRWRLRAGGLLDTHVEYDRFGNSVDQSQYNGQNRGVIGATFLNGIDLALGILRCVVAAD